MSRQSGKTKRLIAKFFKERQIYHRSDGVVHFISMSTRTQIALATVFGAALLWVAYASVNVVFKEQIIVAKERDAQVERDLFSRRLEKSYRAINDMSALNVIMQEQFDEAMTDISSRHQTLKSMVERKAGIDAAIDGLSDALSEAGFPDGSKPKNNNRIMIDTAPAEATPRQSRSSVLKREARADAARGALSAPADSPAGEALGRMRYAAGGLFEEQVLLLASLEDRATRQIDLLERIINTTGVKAETVQPAKKITNTVLAQGGPYVDPSNLSDASTDFFRHANRTSLQLEKLSQLQRIVNSLPIGSPLTAERRKTSGFGVRRDPFNGRVASHHGLDFAARWRAPIVATAKGVVKFSGVRSGFGNVVEIDHGNGFVTRYAHLNRSVVKKGQRVSLNDKIGELGSSGRSTGPHLHYEILFRGKAKNPQRFIEAGRYVFES